jgi:hypothetical protein
VLGPEIDTVTREQLLEQCFAPRLSNHAIKGGVDGVSDAGRAKNRTYLCQPVGIEFNGGALCHV